MDPFQEDGISLTPLEGGWSGETFLADGAGERTVVRIYADPRHPEHAAEITASLLRLVRGLLPVPGVREVRRADSVGGTPALLVTEMLPGVRGDLLLPTLDDAGLGRAGAAVGEIAARLAGMPTLRAGMFVDGDLTTEPFEADLPAWVERNRPALAGAGWSDADLGRLTALAERAPATPSPTSATCCGSTAHPRTSQASSPRGSPTTAPLSRRRRTSPARPTCLPS